jgi:hypothetical protein
MFRVLIACALAAAVSADGHEYSEIEAGAKSCNDTFAALEAPDCDALLDLGHCLANVGISSMPADVAIRISYEHSLIVAQKTLPDCVDFKDSTVPESPTIHAETGDGNLVLNVHEEHEVRAVRFKRNIVGLFKVKSTITDLETKCADAQYADGEIAILAETMDAANTTMVQKVQSFDQDAAALLKTLVDDSYEAINKIGADIITRRAKLADLIENTTAALTTGLDEKVEGVKADTMKALSDYLPASPWANATHDKQYERNYQLVQYAVAPKNTENGHADRVMYKINFNPNHPGFWYPDRRELRQACSRLSEDLKNAPCPNDKSKTDGKDRALKPVCDHERGHWCEGNAVRLNGAYLSHCGCGGYPRKRQCIGMTTNFLRGAVMYNRQNSWNGCWMLRHDGRNCHHHWTDCYNRRATTAIHTLCTSSNGERNTAPFAGCK